MLQDTRSILQFVAHLMTTYVGASTRCAGHLQLQPDLEILPVSADQRVTSDSDTINPLPPSPH